MNKILLISLVLVFQVGFSQHKQMSLSDAVVGRYTYLRPESLNDLQWKNDYVCTWEDEGSIHAYDARKGEKSILITLNEINGLLNLEPEKYFQSLEGYSWMENEELLLQNGNSYYGIDINGKKQIFTVVLPVEAENAVFSEKRKCVVYTLGDNLYVSCAGGETKQITYDGGNGIVNGKAVHRNEFGIENGIFISPEGNYVAFYRLDETMVSDYPLVDYMQRVAGNNPVKYPMAGMNSHQVTVGIYNTATGNTHFLKTGKPYDRYFTNISWSPDEQSIYMAELNREQNHMKLNRYEVASGEKIQTLFEEENETYVEPLYPLLFSKENENEFYYLSRRDGWFHVYRYSVTGEMEAQLTKGEWEVAGILGFTANEKYMFIEAHKESPMELHIYRVELKNGKLDKLTEEEGVHKGIISARGSFVIDRFSGPEIPSQINVISSNGKSGQKIHVADNPLKEHQLGETRLIPLLAADGKTELTGRLILPVDFNPAKVYPVIVYVYGGPHSQLVDKSWLYGADWWQHYMAAKGYIAFTMDNRGTNNRGREFENIIHRQLGILETQDQLRGIEYLKSLPYVDGSRIGVHGWSYGGFMTLNMMLRHPELFKVGVAGGPVVDWSMYEIMYGERYMDTPQENPSGYRETNMMNHIKNLEGRLMLIHGVQDDVVVMQHSMKFLRESVIKGKQVDFFAYPTHPHNIRGLDRLHLMEKVTLYFDDFLK